MSIVNRIKEVLYNSTITAISCPRCHSLNVAHSKSTIINGKEGYNVQCLKCGKKGRVVECWVD